MALSRGRTGEVPGPDGSGYPGRSHAFWAFAALTLTGLVVRWLYFGRYTLEGTGCDAAAYMNVARNIESGTGWVTNSLRFLFLLPPSLPQADAHWSPLLPFLTSLSFGAFGPSLSSAKLVPLLFGALVPGAVFLFTTAMTRSWKPGLLAGVLAVFHPVLVTGSLTVMTEIASVFFVAWTLYLLVSPHAADHPGWLGFALGLAYLMKYQAALLWVAVVAFYALNVPWRTAVRRAGIAGVAFVLVISPWLVRNALTFGDPFYTDLRYNLISYYPEFGGEPRYLSSLDMPVSTFQYLSTHVVTVLKYLKANLQLLAGDFFGQDIGSVLLIPFALLGLPRALRGWRRWTPVAAFASILVILVGISIPQVRYLDVLIPVWLGLSVTGAAYAWEGVGGRRMLAVPVRVGVGLILLLAVADEMRATAAAAGDREALWSPSANYCALEAAAAGDFVRAHTAPADAIFAPETFHYALLLDRNAVHIPFDEDHVRRLAERYAIRYLVITTRDLEKRLPSWLERPPRWAELVHRVPAGEIQRPRANPQYAHVSELRIYQLSSN